MIVQETITVGSRELRKSYSDNGKYIIQVETNIEYSEAIDPLDSPHTYTETDTDIPTPILTPAEQLEVLGVDPDYIDE